MKKLLLYLEPYIEKTDVNNFTYIDKVDVNVTLTIIAQANSLISLTLFAFVNICILSQHHKVKKLLQFYMYIVSQNKCTDAYIMYLLKCQNSMSQSGWVY